MVSVLQAKYDSGLVAKHLHRLLFYGFHDQEQNPRRIALVLLLMDILFILLENTWLYGLGLMMMYNGLEHELKTKSESAISGEGRKERKQTERGEGNIIISKILGKAPKPHNETGQTNALPKKIFSCVARNSFLS